MPDMLPLPGRYVGDSWFLAIAPGVVPVWRTAVFAVAWNRKAFRGPCLPAATGSAAVRRWPGHADETVMFRPRRFPGVRPCPASGLAWMAVPGRRQGAYFSRMAPKAPVMSGVRNRPAASA